jgi:hypothetical protein
VVWCGGDLPADSALRPILVELLTEEAVRERRWVQLSQSTPAPFLGPAIRARITRRKTAREGRNPPWGRSHSAEDARATFTQKNFASRQNRPRPNHAVLK